MKYLMLACLLLAACATAPLTNQIEAASLTVNNLAVQIDQLQKSGAITNDREDELLNQLLEVNRALRLASTLAASCSTDCSNAEAQLRAANELLAKLQVEISK
jgi:septal ring factor EnvC (AmiA/AmiB activator)